jgi:hypothetical protein
LVAVRTLNACAAELVSPPERRFKCNKRRACSHTLLKAGKDPHGSFWQERSRAFLARSAKASISQKLANFCDLSTFAVTKQLISPVLQRNQIYQTPIVKDFLSFQQDVPRRRHPAHTREEITLSHIKSKSYNF